MARQRSLRNSSSVNPTSLMIFLSSGRALSLPRGPMLGHRDGESSLAWTSGSGIGDRLEPQHEPQEEIGEVTRHSSQR